jgi:peptide chain release factor 3
LIEGVYDTFEPTEYTSGQIAPVFFGSAVNNFGVEELLKTFLKIAPEPLGRPTTVRTVEPTEEKFSGFIFKIHANIDPNHRNRIAFLRICSGKFERGQFYYHVRMDKKMRFNNPASFLASTKNTVDEAFPGDVIGLYDSGIFKIGDTITENEQFMFKGIPSFSPEIFKELVNNDPMKTKQLNKGIHQLTDEGVAQLFTQVVNNAKIVGTVGELQFEVIQYRLEHEYGAACSFKPVNFYKACWITSDDSAALANFLKNKKAYLAKDKDDNDVFLASSEWILKLTREEYPKINFHFTSEFTPSKK